MAGGLGGEGSVTPVIIKRQQSLSSQEDLYPSLVPIAQVQLHVLPPVSELTLTKEGVDLFVQDGIKEKERGIGCMKLVVGLRKWHRLQVGNLMLPKRDHLLPTGSFLQSHLVLVFYFCCNKLPHT